MKNSKCPIEKTIEETKRFIREHPEVEIPNGYYCIGKGKKEGLGFNSVGDRFRYYNSHCSQIKRVLGPSEGKDLFAYYFVKLDSLEWNSWAKKFAGNWLFDSQWLFNSQEYLKKHINSEIYNEEPKIENSIEEIGKKLEIANQKLRENDNKCKKDGVDYKDCFCQFCFFDSKDTRYSASTYEYLRKYKYGIIVFSGKCNFPFEDAKIIDEIKTSFKINSYTGKFDVQNKMWEFGCAKISAKEIKNANHLFVSYDGHGKASSAVIIGGGKFTKPQIKEMYQKQFDSVK